MAQEIDALPENENSASSPINQLTTAYNSSSWESDPSSGFLGHPHARDIHIQRHIHTRIVYDFSKVWLSGRCCCRYEEEYSPSHLKSPEQGESTVEWTWPAEWTWSWEEWGRATEGGGHGWNSRVMRMRSWGEGSPWAGEISGEEWVTRS